MIGAAPGHASPLANLVKSNVLLPKRRALAGNLPRDPRGPVGGGRFDDDTANTVGTGPFLEGKKPQRRCGVYGPAARVPNVGSPRRSSSSRARDITSTHASMHTVARHQGQDKDGQLPCGADAQHGSSRSPYVHSCRQKMRA